MESLNFLVGIFLVLLLLKKANTTFPSLYLFILIYYIQYVFSVYLIYNNFPSLEKFMAIPQDSYFEFTMPALFFLLLGLILFNRDINLKERIQQIDPFNAVRLAHLLLVTSFVVDFLLAIGISEVRSFQHFTYYFRYGAIFGYLFSPSLRSYLIISFVLVLMVTNVLATGLFHDLIVWPANIFMMLCLKKNIPFFLRIVPFLISIPLVIFIQTTKFKYREIVWKGKSEAGIETITDIAASKAKKEEIYSSNSSGVISTVGRLNQGWHLGLVLNRVPLKEPFSNGADFSSDIEGILLPRILFNDKKVIGGREKFVKYTGHPLHGGTSMTIGVLGDFYINFGKWGSYIALFIYGAIVSKFLHWFIIKHVIDEPLNIVWVPLLFNFVIRANNDFYMAANSLFKGYLMFLIINYFYQKIRK